MRKEIKKTGRVSRWEDREAARRVRETKEKMSHEEEENDEIGAFDRLKERHG
jgi:hypothetical protein